MSGNFCPKCSRVLFLETTAYLCQYTCRNCGGAQAPSKENNIVVAESKDKILSGNNYYNITRDNLNQKKLKECQKCKHNVMTSIRMDMTWISICDKCGSRTTS